MNFYQEITLIPDAEISPYFLWSKVYTQLHIALADIKNKHGIDGIGVCFPNYRYEEKNGKTFATLGTKLRIFAKTADELEKLALPVWFARLIDYVHLTSVKEVPNKATEYVVVRRYRGKSLERKAKDYAKYKGIGYDEAMTYCQKNKAMSEMPYPYVQMKSLHNGNDYHLSILQEPAEQPKLGSFNAYGMNNISNHVTVPHWIN